MGRPKIPVGSIAASKIDSPGMHAVGGVPGVYLCVSNDGHRSWIFRYSFAGRRRDMGIGSYKDVSLAEAREIALFHRKSIREGNDPLEIKKSIKQSLLLGSSKTITFQKCVNAYLDAYGDSWRNAKHRQQWQNTLETYAAPVIGKVTVDNVDTTLIIKILEPIWKTKTETASRLRGRIEAVLDWAKVRGYRQGENPARWKGHLDKLLAKPSKIAKQEHHAALPYQEIASFMTLLRKQEGIGAAALEFAILTATRSGEVRGATWSEISLAERLWTIPGSRMKAGKEHRVPLSDPAIELLQKMEAAKLNEYVFPSVRTEKPLSDMTLTAVLRRMGRGDLTAHGFRSTFRDWCAETTSYPRDVAEMALAHTIGDKVEAAYRRGDLFEKRTGLMAEWGNYCCTPPASADSLAPLKNLKTAE